MNDWKKAKVLKITQASFDMMSITVEPEQWVDFRAGQHYELRILGTEISRKYSVVSTPHENKYLEFGVQLLKNGIVSPKLWGLKENDEIEIRGPWGESFVWDASMSGTLILLGAGSGITPLISIYNSYHQEHPDRKLVFIMSAKDPSYVMHYDTLKKSLITRFTKTEGRINLDFLKDKIGELAKQADTMCYICGPESFIDDMVDNALELGIREENIKSEKFS